MKTPIATRSLRAKILFTAVALVLLCQLITVAAVLVQAHADAERHALQSLDVAKGVVRSYLGGRQDQLQTAVEVLANDFGFRSAVASGDLETLESALRNHGSRIEADYAVLYDATARELAASTEIRPALNQLALMGAASDAERLPVFFEHEGTVYQSVIVPVLAPVRIGWVALGFALDERLAAMLGSLTGTDVTFVGGVAASGHSLATLGQGSPADPVQTAGYGGFVAVEALPTRGAPIYARLHLDRDQAMSAFHTLATSLILLALVGTVLAAGTAVGLSKHLTRPLTGLLAAARRISQGDYSLNVEVVGNDEIGELARTVGTMQTEIERRETAIRRQAEQDALTGLPNRWALVRHLEDLLAAGQPFQLLALSFQGVHEVNSSLGLETGDDVVRTLAGNLAGWARESAFVARIADNRFCLVASAHEPAGALARELRDLCESRPLDTTPPVSVKVYIGVARSPEHGTQAHPLVRKAWMASIAAGSEARQLAIYDSSSDATIARRRQIVQALRGVAERDELSVVYQPKYDRRLARIDSVEALLRWQHPDLGFVPPDEFITLAESTNSIAALTRFVLGRTARQVARWHSSGLPLRASVNVSPKDVADPSFPVFIMGVLDEQGLAAEHLELEITETALAHDLEAMLSSLRVLRELGIRLAIDDFGTGFSSLSQLKQLPVHCVKIDKSFVLNLADSVSDQLIVRSTIGLAHGMELEVVAEGVEDQASAELLLSWGCDQLQGYLLSRPLPPDALRDALGKPEFGGAVTSADLERPNPDPRRSRQPFSH